MADRQSAQEALFGAIEAVAKSATENINGPNGNKVSRDAQAALQLAEALAWLTHPAQPH